MKETDRQYHAVTGAFGYSGKYITKRLLDGDCKVKTLTNSVSRFNPFGDKIEISPFNFDKPEVLKATLENVSVLYNTYWVRFNHKTFKHSEAVDNTIILFEAAKSAGVQRIVHVSITNPSEDSNLEYFSGKAILEKSLIKTGVSYAILRPTVIFGKEDILVNNIAWLLRKFPIFGVWGDGQYRLQPIYVDDLAKIAVATGKNRENEIINCIGPETFTYRELVETIARGIGKNPSYISISPAIGYYLAGILGFFTRDRIITREEIEGLMQDLLYVDCDPPGKTKLSDWIKENSDKVGLRYTSELKRRRDRVTKYESN